MLLVYDLQRQRGQFRGSRSQHHGPHGWAEDNTGHLLSVCFLWCAATKTLQRARTPRGAHVRRSAPREGGREGRDVLDEVPPGPAGCPPWCWGPSLHAWQRAGTIAAVFEGQGLFQVCLLLFFTGRLRNHAIIKLNWSILAELR